MEEPARAGLRVGQRLIDTRGQDSDEARVEQVLKRGLGLLHFPAQLERRFHDEAAPRRVRSLALNGWAVAILFAGMLIPDAFMVPDRLGAAAWLRLGGYLPISLLVSWLLLRLERPLLREWLVGIVAVLGCTLSLFVIIPSHAPWAPAYVVSLSVIVVYANTIRRMRFWPAVLMCSAAVLGVAAAVALMPGMVTAIAVPVSLLMISTIVFTLYGNYTLEREERYAFLILLRQRGLRRRLQAASALLDQHARFDPLTEVANRRHFDEFLKQEWEHMRHGNDMLSLVLLDVDQFKAYNDHYGHQAGDQCLRAVARALGTCLRRPADLLARWGGEEFAVVLPGTSAEQAREVAERMRMAVAALALPHAASDCAKVVSISIGVASARPRLGSSGAVLLSQADNALYQAKNQGRNQVCAA